MKTTLLSFTLLLIIQTSFAQTGYLGKKFAIKADGYFLPALRSERREEAKMFYAGIASTANFNFTWMHKEKKSVSLEYHYFKDYQCWRTNPEALEIRYLRQRSIGLSHRKYYGDWIAPIGPYRVISLMFNRNEFSQNTDFKNSESYISVKFGFGYGYQRVIFNNFLIDIGVIGYLSSDIINACKEDPDGIIDEGPKVICSQRFVARDFLHLKIGIGYLF